MTGRFEACLPLVLEHEGEWSDNPSDPGGATMKGVTLASFSDYLGREASKAQLRAISDDMLEAIYLKNYWLAASCDKVPPGLDYMLFDLAVNSGPARANRFLQEAAGVNVDGQVGPKTLAAVNALGGDAMVRKLASRREQFYRRLSSFPVFGMGWLNRLSEVTKQALAWT